MKNNLRIWAFTPTVIFINSSHRISTPRSKLSDLLNIPYITPLCRAFDTEFHQWRNASFGGSGHNTNATQDGGLLEDALKAGPLWRVPLVYLS